MKTFLSLLIWSISFICNAADNTYLCITEAAGGVRFDSKQNKFVGSAFDIQNPKKILVKKENDGKWTVKDFGSDIDSVWGKCTERKIKNSLTAISCEVMFGRFGFSLTNLRFYQTYTIPALASSSDYANDEKVRKLFDSNTPEIEVGACSKI